MTESIHDDALTRGMALPVAIRSMYARGLILLPAAVVVLVVAAQFASSTMALKLTSLDQLLHLRAEPRFRLGQGRDIQLRPKRGFRSGRICICRHRP